MDDGVLHVVSDHHGGEAVFLHDPVGESQNLGGGLGVQGGSVLVQQQKLGPLQRGHQKRQRLALAAGEEPHLAGQTVLQTQPQVPQQLPVVRPLRLGDAPAQAAGLAPAGRQRQIFLDLHGGGGAHHRVLKHPTDEFGPLVLRQAGHVHPADDDGAAVHRKGAGHRIEHGGLAGAIAADDRTEVTVLQRQADAPEGLLFIDRPGVERLPDLLDLKHPDPLLFLLRHWRSRRAP